MDPDVVQVQQALEHARDLVAEETQWLRSLETLWMKNRVPRPIELQECGLNPKIIQDNFRKTMLDYWATNKDALKYTESVEPLDQGKLH